MHSILTQLDNLGTSKYKHVSTGDVLRDLQNNGVIEGINSVIVTKTRDQERLGYQKHMVRCALPAALDTGHRMELLVTNSYDGLSSLKFDLGIFRLVCSNGLIVGDSFFSERVRHAGDIHGTVEHILKRLPKSVEEIAATYERASNFAVSRVDALEFSKQALALRGIDNPSLNSMERLLMPNRREDNKGQAWFIFNTVQENFIRYPFSVDYTDASGENKRTTLRRPKAVQSVTEINKGLFDLTMKLIA